MEKITVYVGQVVVMSNGAQQDTRRPVTFEGEKLGVYREYGQGRDGGPTDTRGTTETLIRASDGRLVVHVDEWSKWQGEPNDEWLTEVTEADLRPGGSFEDLGGACGFGRPLTLDEALARGEESKEGPNGEFRGRYVAVHKELSQADFEGAEDDA